MHPTLPKPPPLQSTEHLTLIGHGNVSLDIARLLLSEPSALAKYDVPESVLTHLSQSRIRQVSIVGRRGPDGVKFTAKELREMMNLPNVGMVPIPTELFPSANTTLSRQQGRLLDILRNGSRTPVNKATRTFSIDFWRSPQSFSSGEVVYDLTERDEASGAARITGATERARSDLLVTSLGYEGEPLAWFDDRTRVVRNAAGRVGPRGVYASGWAGGGARGVLGSTLVDAVGVARTIVSDYLVKPDGGGEEVMSPNPSLHSLPPEIMVGLQAKDGPGKVFTYDDWKVVDNAELRRGREMDKERERMGYWDALRELSTIK